MRRVFFTVLLSTLFLAPAGCGTIRAQRAVRAAGYPVEKSSVTRSAGNKTIYVYIGRKITEEERADIKTRVLGAVPNATEVVVYPRAGSEGPSKVPSGTGRPVNSGRPAGR